MFPEKACRIRQLTQWLEYPISEAGISWFADRNQMATQMPERLVVLRDDDANATTPVDRLERLYHPLLAEGHKITFATIPKVATPTAAPSGEREDFIVGQHDEGYRVLQQNSAFVQWQKTRPDLIEIAMHGLTHERVRDGTEFGALDYDAAAGRMDEGLKILGDAFGRQIDSFVAPWDELSRGSLHAAAERFRVISTCFLNRSKLPPAHWPWHYLERIRQVMIVPFHGGWILRHKGALLTEATPDDIARLARQIADGPAITVIVLHHWMFWKNGEHPAIAALARELRRFNVVGLNGAAAYLDQIGKAGWLKMCLGGETPGSLKPTHVRPATT
jgi:peptidoglycan/xylan/chitin deacetylase (PgdA/CDA1 family)